MSDDVYITVFTIRRLKDEFVETLDDDASELYQSEQGIADDVLENFIEWLEKRDELIK